MTTPLPWLAALPRKVVAYEFLRQTGPDTNDADGGISMWTPLSRCHVDAAEILKTLAVGMSIGIFVTDVRDVPALRFMGNALREIIQEELAERDEPPPPPGSGWVTGR